MCGIAGILSFRDAPDRDLICSMIGRLSHRGPDSSGYYRDRWIALGHSRLSIIDTAGGAQPLANEDGTVWVSFNGEIFNYLELAAELRTLGHRFRTVSDTEVIVHAWEEWGPDAFERFNGQWALALWESRTRRLILSRDRLGVRPLYTSRAGSDIIFASEVKALFAHPDVARGIDPEGLGQALTLWSTVAPVSVFTGIRQVPPGCYMLIDQHGERTRQYWHLNFPDAGREVLQDIEENATELRRLVEAATRLRFERSDVPVGAYLSGGLDSTITASVVASVTSAPVRTFSLRFADREFDEGKYQQELAGRLGTEHHEVVVESKDIADVFPDVVFHAENPLLRSAPAPLFLLSRLVADSGYKVVVTGEGADEVLAGYDIFREARLREFWLRDPSSKVRDRGVELLYPWLHRSPTAAPSFARQFFGLDLTASDLALSHRPRWNSTAVLLHLLSPDLRASIVDPIAPLLARMSAGADRWDLLSRAQWLEATTLLPGYILASQGDRMLMANSVEGRFPFLDKDVVEFAAKLPARHKMLGLDEKHILKRAFEDIVPESILTRPKQPYRAPDASSFFGPGTRPDWMAELLSPSAVEDAGIFQPRVVEALVAKCQRTQGLRMSNTDNMRIMAVLSTQLLHEIFVVQGGQHKGDGPRISSPTTVIDNLVNDGSFS
ncbi:asparagine synthase (glutamine-hydrolyzing) [Nakamurella multipartita]|uniref:asparagine synthase (glutamine-hydrolyzing) n=1 Tax=Nakamurella multipartita (strain ATCC 700099 / DSM 44233 / CIP 104796 / JCM 9543 / NBRC 105858 / Y-104) TaxID=479431 RepID=C8XKV4_NAKMY|nr:asparagine synthase (glutamine-hydrolyzing) [Nakamurella multipartita]ACV80761.1 asparagine synthase (glutamine-hydrolyzing) [Nakamurella multipartita DSM 44233]